MQDILFFHPWRWVKSLAKEFVMNRLSFLLRWKRGSNSLPADLFADKPSMLPVFWSSQNSPQCWHGDSDSNRYLCFSWKTRTMGRRSMPAVFASTWPPTKHSLRTSPAHSSLWSARRPPDRWCTVHRPYCRILCNRFQGGCSSLVVWQMCPAMWCNGGLGCCACHMHSIVVPLV